MNHVLTCSCVKFLTEKSKSESCSDTLLPKKCIFVDRGFAGIVDGFLLNREIDFAQTSRFVLFLFFFFFFFLSAIL